MMKGIFEIAGGSVTGRNHLKSGKNNQDAYGIFSNDDFTLAVVCDGCGSSPHSEVGAKLGVKLWLNVLYQSLCHHSVIHWSKIEQEILKELKTIIQSLTVLQSFEDIIHSYFLFTTLGVIITSEKTTIFSLGDGVIAINDELTVIPEFPNNAPPYLAYQLLNPERESNLCFHYQIGTSKVQSILIGTDGVKDFLDATDQFLPGKTDKVGELSQFWQTDRYFKNPDVIRRQLFMINREIIQPNWQDKTIEKQIGLLSDDTTIVSIRRKSNLDTLSVTS